MKINKPSTPRIKRSLSHIALAAYGAIGAIAPDILILYSKRWSMPSLSFSILQYSLATLLYVTLAALVAAIFPYGRAPKPWKAFAVGVALPVVVSSLAAAARDPVISPRGETLPGTLIDILSIL